MASDPTLTAKHTFREKNTKHNAHDEHPPMCVLAAIKFLTNLINAQTTNQLNYTRLLRFIKRSHREQLILENKLARLQLALRAARARSTDPAEIAKLSDNLPSWDIS
jgi:hypothetical protein